MPGTVVTKNNNHQWAHDNVKLFRTLDAWNSSDYTEKYTIIFDFWRKKKLISNSMRERGKNANSKGEGVNKVSVRSTTLGCTQAGKA